MKRIDLAGSVGDRRSRHYDLQRARAGGPREPARRTRPQVRVRAHPAPPPALRLRPRRAVHDGGRGGRALGATSSSNDSSPTRTAGCARSWPVSWPCPRRSGPSSSCRPTRAPTRPAYAATRAVTRLDDGDARRARDQVRDHERLVPARRRGRARPVSDDDEHQHVPGPVRPLLRPRLRAAARPDLHVAPAGCSRTSLTDVTEPTAQPR